ncbi:hypothetical protein [Candidatus Liberibacter americanus]|uniref:hypothetical protein n=1 Tax=Candidatus Liberibacter americanus TaxID=309868 RepID=UPI000347E9F2|nr:hypothetical protein [Candidatus Liberibacter americanus]
MSQRLEYINQESNYHVPIKHKNSSTDPTSFTDTNILSSDNSTDEAQWLKRLTWSRRYDVWPSEWGPSPDEQGCLVPNKLLKDSDN